MSKNTNSRGGQSATKAELAETTAQNDQATAEQQRADADAAQRAAAEAEAKAAEEARLAAEAAKGPKLVAMIRDEPKRPGGPTTADVHPDEVAHMLGHGWRKA